MPKPVRPLWIFAALAVASGVALTACAPRTQTHAPHRRAPRAATSGPRGPVHPAAVDSPLDGAPISQVGAAQRPIAVIVENYTQGRPQWGLSQAARVYESLTEGPITRYLVIFNGAQTVPRVGPVRSIRTQFLNYVAETGAALAHVGGNQDALAMIPALHVMDLDDFHFPSAYRRVPQPGIAYEHTMFTSTAVLRAITDERGWGEEDEVPHPAWKDDAPPSQRPAAQMVTIDFSTPSYRVRWLYRRTTGDYVRELAGRPDIDAGTGTVLRAAAISIMVVHRAEGRTRIHEDTWTYDDVGSGPAWVVEDGRVIPATWHKPWRAARLVFTDHTGAEIAMNRGPQWIEIIPPTVTPVFR
jgi:Protein of unknown function (DUF3048) N-terminal domain/Protein of unknown function (DUF3048) C-terminal domain